MNSLPKSPRSSSYLILINFNASLPDSVSCEMTDIPQNDKDARNEIHQLEIKGEGQRLYNEESGKELSFLVVSQEEHQRLQRSLKSH